METNYLSFILSQLAHSINSLLHITSLFFSCTRGFQIFMSDFTQHVEVFVTQEFSRHLVFHYQSKKLGLIEGGVTSL